MIDLLIQDDLEQLRQELAHLVELTPGDARRAAQRLSRAVCRASPTRSTMPSQEGMGGSGMCLKSEGAGGVVVELRARADRKNRASDRQSRAHAQAREGWGD